VFVWRSGDETGSRLNLMDLLHLSSYYPKPFPPFRKEKICRTLLQPPHHTQLMRQPRRTRHPPPMPCKQWRSFLLPALSYLLGYWTGLSATAMQSIEKSYFRNEDCSFSPPLQVVNRTDDPGKRANNSHDTQIDIQADEFQKMVLEMERAVKAENGNIRKQRSMFLSSADEVYSNVIEEIVPRHLLPRYASNFLPYLPTR
jgi:hypothetical protein